MSRSTQLSLRQVVPLIALTVPLALGLETVLRKFVFVPLVGADLEELREFYWPQWTAPAREAALSEIAWVLVGVTMLAGLLGLVLARRAARRVVQAHAGSHAAGSSAKAPEPVRNKLRDQLLLFASIPQVPAILATLCFSCGARLSPVLISVAVSTAFVLGQGFVGQRLLDAVEPGPGPC
jgi:hypothetical protein